LSAYLETSNVVMVENTAGGTVNMYDETRL
jgi:hypothetical protein